MRTLLDDLPAAHEKLRAIGSDILTRPQPGGNEGLECDVVHHIRESLPLLDELVQQAGRVFKGGLPEPPSEHDATLLARFALTFSLLQTGVLERLRDTENSGSKVNGADEYRARLNEVAETIRPLTRAIQDVQFARCGPAATAETDPSELTDPVTSTLNPFAQLSRGTPIKVRLVDQSPISPFPDPMEESAPFMLPLPEPGQHVQIRDVPSWPLMPPITWRERE